MRFTSTRANKDIESAQAICQGLSEEGGLFVPKAFPEITDEVIDKMADILHKYLASMYIVDQDFDNFQLILYLFEFFQ